jgi:hypothetical protein
MVKWKFFPKTSRPDVAPAEHTDLSEKKNPLRSSARRGVDEHF